MPIFEYQCDECQATFQELVQNPLRSEEIRCSACGSTSVVRLISSFAAGTGEGKSPLSAPRKGQGGSRPLPGGRPAGGGGCGSGCGCH